MERRQQAVRSGYRVTPDEQSYFEPQDIPVSPVLEDDAILVLNKCTPVW